MLDGQNVLPHMVKGQSVWENEQCYEMYSVREVYRDSTMLATADMCCEIRWILFAKDHRKFGSFYLVTGC